MNIYAVSALINFLTSIVLGVFVATKGRNSRNISFFIFISRSAAHELLMLKERLANQAQKREIYFINTSESVAKMLRVVAANRAVPKETTPADDIKTVAIDELTRQRPSVLGFFRRLFAH